MTAILVKTKYHVVLFENEGWINHLARHIHKLNHQWWHDIETGEKLDRNKGELIALMHSELSEMLEGVRKNKVDDHLPHRRAEEVELADLIIRALDYAGAYGFDLSTAIPEKLAYNQQRQDHTRKARLAADGKKF